eukprot:GHUV01019967.1.p1 GENE.GHUV01019967.1~~GHUV01019967.1.p1  ORF type:complete len:135 (+),score=25.84 GHUV01019967.1:157-561(+)
MQSHVCRLGAPTSSKTAHCLRASVSKRLVCRMSAKSSQSSQQSEASTSAPSSSDAAPQQPVTREFRALGSKVIETNVPFKGPEDQEDFWEGDKFDAFGKALENYFVPGLIALGLVCGGIAAKTYNDGATEYIKP